MSAPGAPQFLRASLVSVTNITIQWDRVNCQERNGGTDAYRVVYYPTSNYNERMARFVPGTNDNERMFSVTELPPHTNYTFEVQASNTLDQISGIAANLTVSTTVPQCELL